VKTGHIIALGSLSALMSVVIGAFGAHGITDVQAKAWITTGASQHMAHSLAILACGFVQASGGKAARAGVVCFGVGIILFAGALYALAIGAPRIVAMAAPVGGLSFMAGWACLVWSGLTMARDNQ
jgi:uncharacterized membrane protein YgdD (TMEM256/DUF423 family)